jgi:hypothetical protein
LIADTSATGCARRLKPAQLGLGNLKPLPRGISRGRPFPWLVLRRSVLGKVQLINAADPGANERAGHR